MRILTLTFFVTFWQNQFNAIIFGNIAFNIVRQECKNLQDTPLMRLEKHLFCDYDSSVYPYYHTFAPLNVTLLLLPKLVDFDEDTLSLDSWTSLVWRDPNLTWTPSDYEDINSIHVKSWKIWTPDLWVYNPADMSNHQYELFLKECWLSNTGSVSCVSPMKLNSKCDSDYTYWPYDKHQCRIVFSSWIYLGNEVDILDENGVNMNIYQKNKEWDFQYINTTKEYKTHECCPDEIFSYIEYNFLLTRNYSTKHIFIVIPGFVLIFLTTMVLCLDSKSVERMTLAGVNFVCHLLIVQDIFWQIPYNGVNPPSIMLFYCYSLGLAIFVMILTALLRKLEDIDANVPNWISFTTTYILNNKTGRFLILRDDGPKLTSEDITTEENPNVLKSDVEVKKSAWKHFTIIIDWLSFFCVILTYVIIFIILVPAG